MSFYNSNNGALLLKTNEGTVIDEITVTGNWPAGVNGDGIKKSMERNSDPDTGWHTCVVDGCTTNQFWKTPGKDYGTPGAENLSENDASVNPVPTNLELEVGTNTATFKLSGTGLTYFESATYILKYKAGDVDYEISGNVPLDGTTTSFTKDHILGTCSENSCVYHEPVQKVNVTVTLHHDLFDRIISEEKVF